MTCLMLLARLHVSYIALFADDAKFYRVVRNAEDCSSLQHDLSSVYDWSKDWNLYIIQYQQMGSTSNL